MTLRRSTCIALSAGALATFGAEQAGAQGTETDVAAQFFEAGAAAAQKGEYRVCAEAFTEAHKRAPHGATIYNAGLCWESAKETVRAANDYREALRLGGLSGSQDLQAKKRLATLRAKLGELSINAPHGVRASVGPISGQPIPFTTFVKPGDVEIKLEGPDGEIIPRQVKVDAGDHQDVDLALPKEPSSEKPDKVKPSTAEPEEPSNFQRNAGWVAVGVSAVAAGVGVAYYFSALSAAKDFENTGNTDQGLHDRAVSRYGTAQAFWIAAGVSGVVGVTLILTAPKPSRSPAARLQLRLAPTGASASWAF